MVMVPVDSNNARQAIHTTVVPSSHLSHLHHTSPCQYNAGI